jgi:Protein of unknown function (DUF998)
MSAEVRYHDAGAIGRTVAEPSTPMASQATLAAAGGALGLCVVFVLLLHGLEPEFAPRWRFLSEYSLGRYGWMMSLAFFAWATSLMALAAAFRPFALTRASRVGRALLFVVSGALIVAGLFDQDPVTARPDELTSHGTWHAVASMVGIPGIPIVALLISPSLVCRAPRRARRRALQVATHATWFSLATMAGYLASVLPDAGGFGPTVAAGWMNRLVVLTYWTWQGAVTWDLWRRSVADTRD